MIRRALLTSTLLAIGLLAARPSGAEDPCQIIETDFASLGSTAMQQVASVAPVKFHDIANAATLKTVDPTGALMPRADPKMGAIFMTPTFARVSCELVFTYYLADSPGGYEPQAKLAARCLDDGGSQQKCFSAYADALWKRYQVGLGTLKPNKRGALIATYFWCINMVLMHELAHIYCADPKGKEDDKLCGENDEFKADFFAMTTGVSNGYLADAMSFVFGPLAAVERDSKKLSAAPQYESSECRRGNGLDIGSVMSLVPMYLWNGLLEGGLFTLNADSLRKNLRGAFAGPAPALDHLNGCGGISRSLLSTAYVELKSLSLRLAEDSELLFVKDKDLDLRRADLLLRDLTRMAGGFKEMNSLAAQCLAKLMLRWKLQHDGKAFAEQAEQLLAVPGVSDIIQSKAYGRLRQVEGLVILQERTDLKPEIRIERSTRMLREATRYNPDLAEGWANLAFLDVLRGDCPAAAHDMERSLATTSETGHNLDLVKGLGAWTKALAQDPAKCKAESAKFQPYPGINPTANQRTVDGNGVDDKANAASTRRLVFAPLELVDATGQSLPRLEEYSGAAFAKMLGAIPGIKVVDWGEVNGAANRQGAADVSTDMASASRLADAVGSRFIFTGTATNYSKDGGEETLAVELKVVDATAGRIIFRKAYKDHRPAGSKRGHRELLDSILEMARPDLVGLVAEIRNSS